jgi:hypothetical protein
MTRRVTIEDKSTLALTSTSYRNEFQFERSPCLADFAKTLLPQPSEVANNHRNSVTQRKPRSNSETGWHGTMKYSQSTRATGPGLVSNSAVKLTVSKLKPRTPIIRLQ